MDGQYSWKRAEEAETDLADLLRRLCGQWKLISVCALVSAVVLGGYGWLKDRNGPAASGAEQEFLQAEEAVLTEAEEQAVADAVRLEHEIRGLETYLDSSVLMQLDPYHRNKCVMLYCIDQADRKELPGITESCLNFVLNGGAADALKESGRNWNIDKSCIAELLTAYQKTYSSPYLVIADSLSDSNMTAESLFYVEITGKSAGKAEKMAADLQSVMEDYSARIKDSIGNHRLKLVSIAESVTADSSLQAQQHDKKALLSSSKTNLKAMTDAFSRKQMEAYQAAGGAGTGDGQEEESMEDASGENTGSGIKYAVLGLLGGIFVYGSIFACWYFFSDAVKSTEEMKRLYTFPVYGGIPLENRNGKKSGPARRETCGTAKVRVTNRIRMSCQKQRIGKLCAASDLVFDAQEKECLASMACQLKESGIRMEAVENISSDTAVWDSLAENGNVLMVCRIGVTTHQMIDEAMSFYLENGISVIGAVAFI